MRAAIVVGTRPEVIKMVPVYMEMRERSGMHPVLVLTGQHRELARDAMRIFGIEPDVDLSVMTPGQSLVGLAGRLCEELGRYILDSELEAVLVQGDTTSAMMAGMLAFYQGIPVGHIEAGLRTGNLHSPFPEEFNRRVVALAARWHFAPTAAAAENLRRENINEGVYEVGNTVIDAAMMIAARETERTTHFLERFPFAVGAKRLVLVTAHRRENFGAGMQAIASAIRGLAREWPDLEFVVPVHPNPSVSSVLVPALEASENIHLVAPLDYDEILFLIRRSTIILTDSGGIQEEAPAFDIPVLVMRNDTERPEGIAAGCSLLVGTDVDRILSEFRALLHDSSRYDRMARAVNPYGDGKSSKRIVDILEASR